MSAINSGELFTPQRNNYFYGKLLDEAQLTKEQHYFTHMRRMLNRLTLGSGVVCGLNVVPDGNNLLRLEPGVAIDGLGRELMVPVAITFDPHQLTDDDGLPTDEEVDSGEVEICLLYIERKTDPVPVLVPECNTPGDCANSTIQEGFNIVVRRSAGAPKAAPRSTLGELPLPASSDLHQILCERISSSCQDIPNKLCVVLARVDLASETVSICAGRSLVFNNTLLYELLLGVMDDVSSLRHRQLLRYDSGDGQAGPAGSSLPLPLRVAVLNADGSPADEVTVTFAATDGALHQESVVTDTEGIAETDWTLGDVGTQEVTATIENTPLTVTFHATAIS